MQVANQPAPTAFSSLDSPAGRKTLAHTAQPRLGCQNETLNSDVSQASKSTTRKSRLITWFSALHYSALTRCWLMTRCRTLTRTDIPTWQKQNASLFKPTTTSRLPRKTTDTIMHERAQNARQFGPFRPRVEAAIDDANAAGASQQETTPSDQVGAVYIYCTVRATLIVFKWNPSLYRDVQRCGK